MMPRHQIRAPRHHTNLIPRVLLILVALLFMGQQAADARTSALTPGQQRSRVNKAKKTRATRAVVQQVGLRKAAVNPAFVKRHTTDYKVAVPESRIRDQRKSGRCWAYAWTKTLQSIAANKGKQVNGLSASFINFYALRTLAHGAIDQARRTSDRPQYNLYDLNADMLGEGGYAHWANHIVKRHGIVPESKMSSNKYDARESHVLQNQIHRLVTAAYRDIWRTPDGAKKKRRAIATKYKKQVDTLLKTMVGAPPKKFTVDGKSYTPRTYREKFLKIQDKDLEFVTLTNDPGRAWNRRYSETYAGLGIPKGETYNVSMSTLQGAVKRSLKRGVAVNVAVNVDWDNPHRVANRSNTSSNADGILSMKAFNYGKLVPTAKLTKAERMGHGVSMSNHMMAITGYQPKKRGTQARWKIDNSHGTKVFRGGRFDMYNDYFRHYVEEVTVPRGMVPKGVLKKIEARPALDTVVGMNISPSKGGTKWTPTRKRALVKALIMEDITIDQAAKRYKLPAKRIETWQNDANKAMLDSLR